ncbi:uncharacterized protein LOC127260489 [Andrographis paniculata]|uniref:uncharacterized protein LOC127260489 n=1 Tax=Andrographis paniculata TaxID=175694 RepID=UPI0021E8BAB6|nr:uncharacterized protein LOC127260489 [Andrographis paniculata]
MRRTYKFELEIEMKSSADRVWCSVKDFARVYPKAVSIYEGVQVLQGDGTSAGTIYLSTFKPELKSVISATKERIDFVDEGRRTLYYSFMEGEIMSRYNTFKATVSVICPSSSSSSSAAAADADADGDIGAVVKYLAEIQKANGVPDPDFLKDYMRMVFQGLDAYLLKNP